MNNSSLGILTTTTTVNATHNSQIQCHLDFTQKIQLVLYVLVIVFGVLGNASICYFFGLFSRSTRKGVSEVLILYLAVADFFASIFSPFFIFYSITTCRRRWDFGEHGCKILPLLGRVFINMSVGIIVILALDRYRAICSPFKGQFKKKYIHIGVLVTALLSILCEISYLDALTLYVQPSKSGHVGCLVTPSNSKSYNQITTSILIGRDTFFVVIFTVTSVRIIFNLKKRSSHMEKADQSRRQEMVHVIRVIIVMQIVFVVLVLPRDLLHIIFQISWLDGDGIKGNYITGLNDFLKVIQTTNSCANVFIYAKMHGRFRVQIVKMFHSSLGCHTTTSGNSENDTTTTQMALDGNSSTKQFQKFTYCRKLLRESNRFIMNSQNIKTRLPTYDSSMVKWKSDGSLYDNYYWENE